MKTSYPTRGKSCAFLRYLDDFSSRLVIYCDVYEFVDGVFVVKNKILVYSVYFFARVYQCSCYGVQLGFSSVKNVVFSVRIFVARVLLFLSCYADPAFILRKIFSVISFMLMEVGVMQRKQTYMYYLCMFFFFPF